ncbi:MAG: hypothetical protein MUO85_07590 [candidate division Zixibacteria bacterium]|nr:hypothetical protein [candidate division Zixibacteria bacterium]
MSNHSEYIRKHPELKHVWQININYFNFLRQGARRLLELCKIKKQEMDSESKNLTERGVLKEQYSNYVFMSVLMYIVSAEAFINRFYEHCTNICPEKRREIIRYGTLEDKWADAPGYAGSNTGFDIGGELFRKFKELIEIRNYFVHAKGDITLIFFANYTVKGPDTKIYGPNGEIIVNQEYVEGAFWSDTKIPRDPRVFECRDAEEARKVVLGMISKLRELVGPNKVNEWLFSQENMTYIRERKEDDELLK